MLDLYLWTFIVFGITIIITTSKAIFPLRHLLKNKAPFIGELLSCPLCFAFWVSIFVSYFWYSPTNNILLDCFYGSGTTHLLYCITWKLALFDDRF